MADRGSLHGSPEAGPVAERTCIECGGPMERGFLVDFGYGTTTQEIWVEGEPVKGRFSGQIKLKKETRQFPIETFRCMHCGALRSYAVEPGE